MTEKPPIVHKIKVSLSPSARRRFLETDAKGGTNVPHSADPQGIAWSLTGELADGEFVPLSETKPGFEWLSWPPPEASTFGLPRLINNVLEIDDTNDAADGKGGWIYKLRVKYQGVIYETVLQLAAPMDEAADPECDTYARILLKDNPVIINR